MNARSGQVCRPVSGGIELRIRLTPKSSADRVEGMTGTAEGPAVAAKVRAVPSDGEANSALERLIADWLGLSKSSISVTAGHKSRVKSVFVSGDTTMLTALMEARLGVPVGVRGGEGGFASNTAAVQAAGKKTNKNKRK